MMWEYGVFQVLLLLVQLHLVQDSILLLQQITTFMLGAKNNVLNINLTSFCVV